SFGDEVLEIIENRADFFQHMLAGNPLQLNAATGWKIGKIGLNLPVDSLTSPGQEGAEFCIQAISMVSLAHEVENGQAILSWGVSQAAAELLEKDGQALRGAKEHHKIDLGDIN